MDTEEDPDQEHIDARNSQGSVNQPSGPVEQVFGDQIAGDKVLGDKVAGDKVLGTKVVIEAEAAYDVRGLPNPYLGLRAFTYDDREAYAGREALIQEAFARLTDPTEPQTLLFITGDSGSGKSSFAQAGLLPALEAYYQKRGKTVRLAVFRPGKNPLATLGDALSQLGNQVDTPSPGRSDPETFGQGLAEGIPADQINLLVIDQFEEMFTQSQPEGRGWVFSFLSNLPRFEHLKTHLIATLRSDYLKELFQSEVLWQIAKGGVELRAMSQEALQSAILGPMEARGRKDERYRLKKFEADLLERLAQDAGQDATYLPLLQVTLEDLWQRGELRLGDYGGLGEAIRRRAETVYAFQDFERTQPEKARPESERDALLDLLLDFVEVSSDDDARRDVRRRREKDDLTGDSILRGKLVEDLTQARLLSVSQEPSSDGFVETVDIIHESLIANWERLREAIAARRELLKQRGRFETALDEWSDRGKSADYLLTGVRLAEGGGLREAGDIALRSEAAREFLNASEAQAEAAHQRELEKERRRARTARIFTGAIGVALLIAILAAGWATRQTSLLAQEQSTSEARRIAAENAQETAEWQAGQLSAEKATSEARRIAAESAKATAEAEQKISHSRELAAVALDQLDNDPERALLLALEAARLASNFETQDALRQSISASQVRGVLVGHTSFLSDARYSPDGRWIVTASNDGTARVWDAVTFEAIAVLPGHSNGVNSLSIASDGTILTLDEEGTARLWNGATGDLLITLPSISSGPVTFSPDGRRIVAPGKDGIVRIFETASGKELIDLKGHSGVVNDARFSLLGDKVVTAGEDGTVRIWEASSGRELLLLRGHEFAVLSAQFIDLFGDQVLTTGLDGTLRIWQGDKGEERLKLSASDFALNKAQFSPDGDVILTNSNDATTRLWDAQTGDLLRSFIGQQAEFSPDGRYIVTTVGNSTAMLWETASGRNVAVLRGHKEIVQSAHFSPDGRFIVTGSMDGTARIWDSTPAKEWLVIQEPHVRSAQFSPDGSRLLTANFDYTARLWDLESRQELLKLAHPDQVEAAFFSPDGQRVVTTCDDGITRIWDAVTGEDLIQLRSQERFSSEALFSPDGALLATASTSGLIRLWKTEDGQLIKELPGHQLNLFDMRFSPDGKHLLSLGADNSLRLWEIPSGKTGYNLDFQDSRPTDIDLAPQGDEFLLRFQNGRVEIRKLSTGDLRLTLTSDQEAVNSAHYSPDGDLIVTTGVDATTRLWDSATGRLLSTIRGHDEQLSGASFSPDGAFLANISWDGTAHVWDVANQSLVAILREPVGVLYQVEFSPGGRYMLTLSDRWRLSVTLRRAEDLIALANSRVTRELTCEERVQYLHESLTCPTPTSVPP